jgi:hypothetical protein
MTTLLHNIVVSLLDISTADTMVLSDGTMYSYGFYILTIMVILNK